MSMAKNNNHKLPTSFRIKGKKWKVRFMPECEMELDGMVCNGICDFDKREIHLKAGLPKKQTTETLLHELWHAAMYEAHINPGVRFGNGIEEVLCDAFADTVTSLFTFKWKRK